MLNPFDSIIKLLADVPTVAALRERMMHVREQLETLSNDYVKLEQENARLVQRNRELEEQVEAAASRQQFVEHRGVLFKPLARGGYSESVYCPKCGTALFSLLGTNFSCSKCHYTAPLTGRELKEALKELAEV